MLRDLEGVNRFGWAGDGSYRVERRQDPGCSGLGVVGELVVFEELDEMLLEFAADDCGDCRESVGDLLGVSRSLGIGSESGLGTPSSTTRSDAVD